MMKVNPHSSEFRFLGADDTQAVLSVRQSNAAWFDLANRAAVEASRLLSAISVHRGDVRELLAALLFQRVVVGFEAVLVLGERGMHTQALVQRRSMLEALFVLGAIWNKPELAERYLAADSARVLKNLRRMEQLPAQIFDALRPEITRDSLKEKIAQLKTTAPKSVPSVADYAEAAELQLYYLTDYAFSSEAAHHVAKDLERHIHVDEDGDIDGFSWGPEDVSAAVLLLQAVEYLLLASVAVEKLFGLYPFGDLERLREETGRLGSSGEKVENPATQTNN